MADPCKDCKAHAGIEVLCDAICKKIEEKEKIANIKFDALYEAIKMAKSEMDRRLEGMNEFRNQLSQQATTFISKREVELILDKFEGRLRIIEDIKSVREGSSRWSDYIITVLIAMASSIATGVVFLIAHYLLNF